MKRSKFSDSQIMDAVKRVEAGIGVPDMCRELGISTATFYKWRAKYGGIDESRLSAVLQTGVDSVAMVRAITEAPDPESTARGFMKTISNPGAI